MTIDLRREVERALDRNGLVEAGWTTEAIEEAMAGDYATSRFSKLEAAVVMPFIEAIARERDGLRALVERFVAHDADARENPLGGLSLGGLMDARDNSGVVYQSQALADDLTEARQALKQEPQS